MTATMQRTERLARRETAVPSEGADLLVPIGRALFALIFLMTVQGHFTPAYIGYAAQQGVPLPGILVPLSGVIAIAGGLSILLGFKARFGAWLLVLFLVPVTLVMHRYWTIADPLAAGLQKAMFLKNVSMLGGALIIAGLGAGPYSVDAWSTAQRSWPPHIIPAEH